MGNQSFPQIITPPSIADGTANTAGTAASMIPVNQKITLPNNYWTLGKLWRITASGRISCAVTTPGTARYDVRIGAVIAFDSLAMNLNIVAKTSVHWMLEIILQCRAVGASTTTQLFPIRGNWQSEAVIASPVPTAGGSGEFLIPYNTAPALGTGFDNTVQNTVDMFFTQTVGTGSHQCHSYQIEELN